MQRLFREAGMPRRQSPAEAQCGQIDNDSGDAPMIVSPNRGATYTLQLSKMTPIALRANATGSRDSLFWFANGGLIGKSRGAEALAWLPSAPGRFQLRVIDQQGRADVQEVDIEFVP